ncbi:hypothetical protein GCM10010361_77750 [Streptomyces olivaceiscleroticus]|uniref:Uncharacterized protein n=1 Tax=Streptomyces olivaceiscleroticus TaxID=68245 RepID=A0ABN1BNG9_9ACTN
MTGRQLDVEGREVPAEQVGPPPPPPEPAPKKPKPAPPAECAGQIPMPLPREVLLCDTDEVPPLLLW